MNKTTEERLDELERKFKEMEDVKKKDSTPDILRRLTILERLVEVVSAVPTTVPSVPPECFKLYVDGATYRLYVYVNGTWKYAALT